MRKKKTRQKKVLYGELGSFCIDFAKYMATGVVITTLLKDLEGHNALIYLFTVYGNGTRIFNLGTLYGRQISQNEEKEEIKKQPESFRTTRAAFFI